MEDTETTLIDNPVIASSINPIDHIPSSPPISTNQETSYQNEISSTNEIQESSSSRSKSDHHSSHRDKDKRRRTRSRSRSSGRHHHHRDKDRDHRSKDKHRERREREKSPPKYRDSLMDYDPYAEIAKQEAEFERDKAKDERTIFVSQIHPRVDEKGLFDYFSMVGKVTDIKLIRDSRTRKSKGLCYIELDSVDYVLPALALSGQLLQGYPINVQLTQAEKNRDAQAATLTQKRLDPFSDVNTPMKIYIGNLHEDMTEKDLYPIFEAFGHVNSLELVKNKDGISKGFGFVLFRKSIDAKNCIEQLNGLDIAGKSIRVSISTASDNLGISETAYSSRLDTDELAGVKMDGASRLSLMHKLAGTTEKNPKVQSSSVNPLMLPSSPCLLIKNMFDPATETDPNFHLEIQEDVVLECSKFGKITHCFVDKHSQGYVYLKFANSYDAKEAKDMLHNRWFASRQITADLIPEATYDTKFPGSRN